VVHKVFKDHLAHKELLAHKAYKELVDHKVCKELLVLDLHRRKELKVQVDQGRLQQVTHRPQWEVQEAQVRYQQLHLDT
jgi:hypothetical protein